MEHELMKLCKDLINALTKDNYDLIKRFVKLEEEFNNSLPTPETTQELPVTLPGAGKQQKGAKTFKPEIAQGKMPWEADEQPAGNLQPPDKTEKKETGSPSWEDLPF